MGAGIAAGIRAGAEPQPTAVKLATAMAMAIPWEFDFIITTSTIVIYSIHFWVTATTAVTE
jgi:hypothetical protein